MSMEVIIYCRGGTQKKEKDIRRLPCGCRGLTPVILATQEAEIRRIMVQSQTMGK
jgi:hypothetical protein